MVATQLRARWLREMGYRPLALRQSRTQAGVEVDSPATPAAAAPLALPSSAAAVSAEDPLWIALLRACHAQPEDAATLGWKRADSDKAFAFVDAELHIDLTLLRDQPEAKRALWRTLRALRRQRRDAQ